MTRVLRPFQVQGVEFLSSRDRALLFDDPGLGKTTQAISAWGQEDPVVVVCPKSVKRVWEREIREVSPGRTISVLSGRTAWRPPGVGETVVLNWDILPKSCGPLLKGTRLVGDEVHYAKSPTSQRSQAFFRLGSECLRMGGSVWGLTGTPLVSWPQDLYGVHRALHLETAIWGSYRNFVSLFRGYQTTWGMKWGKPRDEVPGLMKRYCLGRSKTEVLPELPARVFARYDVETKETKEEREVSVAELQVDSDKTAASAKVSEARAALALAKAKSREFEELLTLWLEEGPFVVFSAHRAAARHVASLLQTESYDGEQSAKRRGELEDEFTSGKSCAIVGTIGAMGVGLTLTRASRVVFLDRAWTPAENLQAEDRAVRMGQTKNVQIVDIVSSTSKLDDAVFRLLDRKKKIIQSSTEADRA